MTKSIKKSGTFSAAPSGAAVFHIKHLQILPKYAILMIIDRK